MAHEISSKLHVAWRRGHTQCLLRFKNVTAYFPAVSFPLRPSFAIAPACRNFSDTDSLDLVVSDEDLKTCNNLHYKRNPAPKQDQHQKKKGHNKRLPIYRGYFGNHLHKRNIQNDTIPFPSRYHVRRRGSRTTGPGSRCHHN